MATKKKKISELTPATSLVGLWTIGTDGNNNSVKVNLTWLKEVSDDLARIKTNAETTTEKANKAATDANNQMTRISQEVSQKMTDLRQLEAEFSDDYTTWGNSYSQWQAKEQARQNDEVKRQEAAAATADAERLRALKEAERNTTFDAKVKKAEEATEEAKKQAAYAKEQGSKISVLQTLSESEYEQLVQEGKVDEAVYYCTFEEEE